MKGVVHHMIHARATERRKDILAPLPAAIGSRRQWLSTIDSVVRTKLGSLLILKR